MHLKCHKRVKDGKEHRYWSIVEKHRCPGGRIVDRHVFYLGEINDSQKEAWTRRIAAFGPSPQIPETLALFPSDQPVPAHAAADGVQVRLSEFRLERPRQWGACWLALQLWEVLDLDAFWTERLPPSREGTSWLNLLKVLTAYRLIDPGSEWRLHRQWFRQSALADLLGEDFSLVAKDNPYRCLDRLLEHQAALFTFLQARWKDLFGATFDVLLYDLTSTYFESDPPFGEQDKRQFGYSRDKRSDCVQVVIALIVTPEGFPLAYEVLSGNTTDKTTLRGFLAKIEKQYGKARRTWIMDRGIPTEEVLAEMRASDPPVQYVVGTARARLCKLEARLKEQPWHQARASVQVKLLSDGDELYVLVHSQDRVQKDRAIRRRKLKTLWARLKELHAQRPSYEALLLKLGAAKAAAGRVCWSLVEVTLPAPGPTKKARSRRVDFTFTLDRKALRAVCRREGRYLLRTNLTTRDPVQVWEEYLQLAEVEAAFKDLKGDLSIRPIYHQKSDRIEAHIFVAFLAYSLHTTLKAKLRPHAPGLTPRVALEKMAALQMLDVYFPTTDGRELIFARYTQPERDQQILLAQLGWTLPAQAPPKITAKRAVQM
jgi:transposase